MLYSAIQLDEQQLKDLDNLRLVCKKKDGSTPNLYPHILMQPRALPASLLHYESDQLVGFLSAFFFYDAAVEIALLVNPEYRRKGFGKQLMQSILPLIQSHNFSTLIFSSPSNLNNSWLQALGFSLLHSEYFMEREDLNPLLDYNQSLQFRVATENDIPALSGLDEACFANKQNEFSERFQNLLNDRNYQIVIALHNNQIIGKAHLRWNNDNATLSDIAIVPTLQSKGYGSALIAQCINIALSEGKSNVNLDVETHNERALHLYTRLGFHIQNACDYWSISIGQLNKI